MKLRRTHRITRNLGVGVQVNKGTTHKEIVVLMTVHHARVSFILEKPCTDMRRHSSIVNEYFENDEISRRGSESVSSDKAQRSR